MPLLKGGHWPKSGQKRTFAVHWKLVGFYRRMGDSFCVELNSAFNSVKPKQRYSGRPGGLKEQVQQSVNFSEHANHETGHSRLRNIVTTWRLNEPSLPD